MSFTLKEAIHGVDAHIQLHQRHSSVSSPAVVRDYTLLSRTRAKLTLSIGPCVFTYQKVVFTR